MARSKANKAIAEQRTDEVLRIVLDGAMLHDVVAFVRENERDPESVWHVPDDGTPLSEAMIRKYIEYAYDWIDEHHEKSRRRLLRRHLARVQHLYGKTMVAQEFSVALAALKHLAEVQRLMPSPADEMQRQIDELRRQMREEKERNGNAGNSQAGAGSAAS
jgi:predicted RNase H-like nuclease (RuvC/YqgF family)